MLSTIRSFKRFAVQVVLTATMFAFARPTAADFSFELGGHSYLVVTSPKTWMNAAADAASRELGGLFGELARIDDQAENDAIAASLVVSIPPTDLSLTRAPDGSGGAYVWIAATDRQAEGEWIWDGDGDGSGDQFWQGDQAGNAVSGLFNL